MPYKYFPFNWSDTARQENRELFLRSLTYIAACVLAYFVAGQFSVLALWMKIFSVIALAFLVIYCYLLIVGFANPVNFNRNSASLALLASLAKHTAKKQDVAYVLLDKNTSANTGFENFGPG